MILALVGNQNCGKTTLFNCLTGSDQHVGNFPGVTVDQKIGDVRGVKDCAVVDLPGIYSIRPYSTEEKVTRDFIFGQRPDGIINIIDATNPQRNLYLTLQLLELRLPMVVALNMMDELVGNGGSVDIPRMERELGVPVVPISAMKNEGVGEVIDRITAAVRDRQLPQVQDFCPAGPVHRCIHAVSHIIEDHAQKLGIAPRFCATKVIEEDPEFIERLALDQNELELIEHSVVEMEDERGLDRNAALADMRYAFIERVCGECVIRPHESREHRRSVRIDSVLTNRFLALPLFLLIMLTIFWLTFSVIGQGLSDLLAAGIDALSGAVDRGLTAYQINPVVHSLIIDGIFAGVGSVLSFLPIIVVLFFFLSVLEDTGYMARVAFVMDRLLRKIGLSGRSFVPMLIGFGCSVPAVMASRTLSSDRDRKMTILLIPYISCSAKIPIYAVFTAAFFPRCGALVMAGLYVGGILIGILAALFLRSSVLRGKPAPFVMELPNYRLPSPRSVLMLMWEKARDFLQKAFTVIFLATVAIWFLQTFDARLDPVTSGEQSLLAAIGRLIAPVFAPLGFADWRAATALVCGFTAKEAVISTLGVLTGTAQAQLGAALSGMFTPAAALSFLTFTLLYTPCVAAVATIRRELRSVPKTVGVVIAQCAVAWVAAGIVYMLAGLLL